MLRIFVSLLFSILLAQPASASTREERAREMAECGYLAVLAAEDAAGPLRRDLVSDIADFTNLFCAYARIDRPVTGQGVSSDMLGRLVTEGRALHARRLTAMSPQNALRLSNRMLQTCRSDLSLLVLKMRTEAGLSPQR